jgi:hypothetical protein
MLGYEDGNPGGKMMLTTLLILSLIGAPSTRSLLLDIHAQEEFVQTYAPNFVRIHFKPPLAKEVDRSFQQAIVVLGTVTRAQGETVILAPTYRLGGVQEVNVEFADGSFLSAAVEHRPTEEGIPFVKVIPKKPGVLEKAKPLKWAQTSKPTPGRLLWAIEWPLGQQLPDSKARPILIRTTLGERVEPPLDRFHYAAIGRSDGLALLNQKGEIQCLVFRAVPGLKNKSLCAPEKEILAAGRPTQ